MAPFFALVLSFILLRSLGAIGWVYFDDWHTSLQGAVAVMLLLTASAHWGKKRKDLIRMVPPSMPSKEAIVTITGLLEIAGAIGIMVPVLSLPAAAGLVLLLLAMFPANVYAARAGLMIGGRPVTRLPLRILLQLLFLAAIVLASPLLG